MKDGGEEPCEPDSFSRPVAQTQKDARLQAFDKDLRRHKARDVSRSGEIVVGPGGEKQRAIRNRDGTYGEATTLPLYPTPLLQCRHDVKQMLGVKWPTLIGSRPRFGPSHHTCTTTVSGRATAH